MAGRACMEKGKGELGCELAAKVAAVSQAAGAGLQQRALPRTASGSICAADLCSQKGKRC